MQNDMKNAVEKLEQLYNRTYTDTFGALKTQMDAMQKHIFNSTVGATNTSEPDRLRFQIIGFITEKHTIAIDDLCGTLHGVEKNKVLETVYILHQEGLITFDGRVVNEQPKRNVESIQGQG